MELFSEIYGTYYNVVARLLAASYEKGLSLSEMEEIVGAYGFSESVFQLLPKITSDNWDLFELKAGRYYSKLKHKKTNIPLTTLQKRWLKSILIDKRIGLFLDEEHIALLDSSLDVENIYDHSDFHLFDVAADGDDYTDSEYRQHFRQVLFAVCEQKTLRVRYAKAKGGYMLVSFKPNRIVYSTKDDKFRVKGTMQRGTKTAHLTMNISRIQKIEECSWEAENCMEATAKQKSITISIKRERNALERCMLQFAAYQKETLYDEKTDCYICTISHKKEEISELVIRVLSFGPTVEVLSPNGFIEEIKAKLTCQFEAMEPQV